MAGIGKRAQRVRRKTFGAGTRRHPPKGRSVVQARRTFAGFIRRRPALTAAYALIGLGILALGFLSFAGRETFRDHGEELTDILLMLAPPVTLFLVALPFLLPREAGAKRDGIVLAKRLELLAVLVGVEAAILGAGFFLNEYEDQRQARITRAWTALELARKRSEETYLRDYRRRTGEQELPNDLCAVPQDPETPGPTDESAAAPGRPRLTPPEQGNFGQITALESLAKAGQSLAGLDFPLAYLQGVDLRGPWGRPVNLSLARLCHGTLTLAQAAGAGLFGARLQGADLRFAQLQEAYLSSARLQGAILVGTRLKGANFFRARLQGATLEFVQLQGADLGFVQLQGANLFYAQLRRANLFNAQLHGANLSGADLIDARGLTIEQLSSAIWSPELPPELPTSIPAAEVARLTEDIRRRWGSDAPGNLNGLRRCLFGEGFSDYRGPRPGCEPNPGSDEDGDPKK